jgi:hypothetical protein
MQPQSQYQQWKKNCVERHLVLGLFGQWLACLPVSIAGVAQSSTEEA